METAAKQIDILHFNEKGASNRPFPLTDHLESFLKKVDVHEEALIFLKIPPPI